MLDKLHKLAAKVLENSVCKQLIPTVADNYKSTWSQKKETVSYLEEPFHTTRTHTLSHTHTHTHTLTHTPTVEKPLFLTWLRYTSNTHSFTPLRFWSTSTTEDFSWTSNKVIFCKTRWGSYDRGACGPQQWEHSTVNCSPTIKALLLESQLPWRRRIVRGGTARCHGNARMQCNKLPSSPLGLGITLEFKASKRFLKI